MHMERRSHAVGVDGGQSRTVAVVATTRGELIGVGRAGPCNNIREPGGLERLRDALASAIQAALAQASALADSVDVVYAGLTGGWDLAPAIIHEFIPGKVIAEEDTVIALAGASICGTGVVLIAGTGSVAFGRNKEDVTARAGGWGYLMGDEGSGYDVSLAAVRAAAKAADGRGPKTALTGMISTYLEVEDLEGVHRKLYSGSLLRGDIAGIAKSVARAANAGDMVAIEILKRAGDELAMTAAAVIHRLGLAAGEAVVYPVGGLFSAGNALLRPLEESLTRCAPGARLMPPAFAPVIGAVFLGLQACSIELSKPILDRVRSSMTKLELED